MSMNKQIQFEKKKNLNFMSFNQSISMNIQDFSQTFTHFKKKNSSFMSFNQSISMNIQDFSQTFTHFKKKNSSFVPSDQSISTDIQKNNNTQAFESIDFKIMNILMSFENYLILGKHKIGKSL